VEDNIVGRYAGISNIVEIIPLNEQLLLTDFSNQEIATLVEICEEKNYNTGDQIIFSGESANAFYFLLAGKVSVKLPSGVRLSSLSAGMSFGEMALLEDVTSADVWADTDVKCLELKLNAYNNFRIAFPLTAEKLMKNGAYVLSQRLRKANTKVDILTSFN